MCDITRIAQLLEMRQRLLVTLLRGAKLAAVEVGDACHIHRHRLAPPVAS